MTETDTSRAAEATRVINAAMTLVAESGLRGLTLRDLAQAVGKSTTVIVNLFGAKAGVVEAMANAAYDLDEAYHRDFAAEAGDVAFGRDALFALVGRYLRDRALPSAAFARVRQEMLAASTSYDFAASLLVRWETMRRATWTHILAHTPRLEAYGDVLATYLIVEEFYAGALAERAEYEMIAAEGLGGLIDHMFGRLDDPTPATDRYVDRFVIPGAPGDLLEPGSMKLKLLEAAADQILAEGVSAVTNRSVSGAVGTSTSTIAYHWSDMRAFVTDALWHAVFRGMPRYLDHRRPSGDARPDDARWTELMLLTLQPDGPGGRGFYVNYARLIAGICLEARRNPGFRELAMMLRGPEGGGTYVNRDDLWPTHFDLTRRAATRFALWIKGEALAAAATGRAPSPARLKQAAALLVSERS
ncbi:TetR family transcriptional regulator [Caulobacter mirabilis]|uniref:TetR family transcriptional regulator n=1 Tax=Caulobacter mirabilis TaxID=69666 RepID=A0A2D2B2W8_9CAUL|nr:TetR family transcriptional regulator [Caulobacter mirabilis]ATQ44588.1 TetR family transcriptional regulator [Caulobacter mirabilis]